MTEVDQLAQYVGVTYFDYQLEAFEKARQQTGPGRMCLYYKTGAGKTITGLSLMALWGQPEVLVLAPPATHDAWQQWAQRHGLVVETISHAKFRQKDYRVSRTKAVIVDEFHLLGGHSGKGWKKLDTMARHLQAPLVLMSATPNYNDAERVYCIQHVLDPHSCKGGYLEFIYRHCVTEQNPFGQEPKVLGFHRFKDAAEYLSSLPYVEYLPDDLVWSIQDIGVPQVVPPEMETYGLNVRKDRIMASIIEEKHAVIDHSLVTRDGCVRQRVMAEMANIINQAGGPVLVFANHSTVAEAFDRSWVSAAKGWKVACVTGSTPAKKKAARIDAFRDGVLDVLIGTATLATGTDGLDKVCDTLIILDDTDDDSLRRQLVGRIMPRGEGGDASTKQVYRLVLQ